MRTVSGSGSIQYHIIQPKYPDYFRSILTKYFVQLPHNLLAVVLVIYTELVRNNCVLCILRKFFMHGQLFFPCMNYVFTHGIFIIAFS